MEVVIICLSVLSVVACWRWLYWFKESRRFEGLAKESFEKLQEVYMLNSNLKFGKESFEAKYEDLVVSNKKLAEERRELRDELTYLKTKTKPVIGEDEVDFSYKGVCYEAPVEDRDKLKRIVEASLKQYPMTPEECYRNMNSMQNYVAQGIFEVHSGPRKGEMVDEHGYSVLPPLSDRYQVNRDVPISKFGPTERGYDKCHGMDRCPDKVYKPVDVGRNAAKNKTDSSSK